METDLKSNTTTTPEPFARLSRWLDMFDEIRATDPAPTEK